MECEQCEALSLNRRGKEILEEYETGPVADDNVYGVINMEK